jgi:putative SOS response-associated peptidase YedK
MEEQKETTNLCGRFTLHASPEALAHTFDIEVPPFEPRYNIAPSQPVATVRMAAAGRVLAPAFWGLVPPWSREPNAFANARAETVATRHAFRSRRCSIPADGFYEWKAVAGRKQPFYYRLRDDGLFAFAGLWEPWRDVATCALITTAANGLVRRVHPRMPAILSPDAWAVWLDADARPQILQALLRPYPVGAVESFPVSTRVNSGREEGPDLIRPVELGQATRASPSHA